MNIVISLLLNLFVLRGNFCLGPVEHSIHQHTHHHNHQYLLHDALSYQAYSRKIIHMSEFKAELLETTLSSAVQDDINYLWIKTLANQSIETVGIEVDRFILTRPWWIVELEPYTWNNPKHDHHHWDIVLVRIPSVNLAIFKSFSETNFGDTKHCSRLPLIVSNHDGDAWGNRLSNIQMEWDGRAGGAIFYIFTSYDATDKGRVSFAESRLCPGQINKWECLFLPMSNCSLPKSITDCRQRECLPRPWGVDYYTNASWTGAMYPRDKESEFLALIKEHFPAPDAIANGRECITLQAMKSSDPVHWIHESTTVRKQGCVFHAASLSFVYGFYLRFNAVFRSRIALKMFSLRNATMPHFTPNATCVAAHIRMDDRSIPNTNMIEWCAQCASYATGSLKYNQSCKDTLKIRENIWMNMGCFSGLPFGAATLEHYINASKVVLPSNRNLFVLTDDEPWLKPELERYRARVLMGSIPKHEAFNIIAYPAGEGHREASSDATVDFWASIKLAQQCQGFVGHFSSTATLLVFRSMCYRHGNHNFLSCPPAFDIGAQNL